MQPIYQEQYTAAAQEHAFYTSRGSALPAMPSMADIPDPLFAVDSVVEVMLQEKRRKARVEFVALSHEATWSYGLQTCDSEPVLRTIKNESNWDSTGHWSGGGPFAMIQSAILDIAKEKGTKKRRKR